MTVRESQDARAGRVAAVWSDRVWWVLAGGLLSGGYIGTIRTYGMLGSALLAWVLVLFACALSYGIVFGSGLRTGQIVRRTALGTIVGVGVVGLALLDSVAGPVAVVVAAVTSPAVVSRLTRLQPASRAPARRRLPACLDQATVDREFAALVAQLRDERHGP
jgi:hypothetical protein